MLNRLILLLLISVFAVACGDNMMDSIADDDSSTAKTVELENALNDKDYDYIIGKLSREGDEDPDYTSLSSREKYLLMLAWLGKTKFDVLGNIEQFFEDDVDTTKVLSGLQPDINDLNSEVIAAKQPYYTSIHSMTEPKNGTVDDDMQTVAGIASAMQLLMTLSDVVFDMKDTLETALPGVSFDNVSFNEGDPNYIVTAFENLNESDVKTILEENEGALLGILNQDLDQLVLAAETLVPDQLDGNTDVKDKLDEYIFELKDPTTDLVTAESAYKFITDYMKNNNK